MTEKPDMISLEIDSLVFEGISQADARRASASFESTLQSLIESYGLPRTWQRPCESDLDLSGFAPQSQHPRIIGENLARFIYRQADQ